MICIIKPGGSGEHVRDNKNISISLNKPGGSGTDVSCRLDDTIVCVGAPPDC